MNRDIFQIIGLDLMPWPKAENGKEVPVKGLWLKCVTSEPAVDEVLCTVYGIDATQKYDVGDYVLATVEIFVSFNEDSEYKQVIRARDIKVIDLPKGS